MEDGRELLIAWLHDPPDKPLDIRGHVSRACRYLSAAIRSHAGRYAGSRLRHLPHILKP